MVTVSPSGPPGLFKGVTTAMSGVLAFPAMDFFSIGRSGATLAGQSSQ